MPNNEGLPAGKAGRMTNNNSKKLLSEEKEILQEEKSLLATLNERVGMLAAAIERTRIDEYTSMLTRPWRFFFFK